MSLQKSVSHPQQGRRPANFVECSHSVRIIAAVLALCQIWSIPSVRSSPSFASRLPVSSRTRIRRFRSPDSRPAAGLGQRMSRMLNRPPPSQMRWRAPATEVGDERQAAETRNRSRHWPHPIAFPYWTSHLVHCTTVSRTCLTNSVSSAASPVARRLTCQGYSEMQMRWSTTHRHTPDRVNPNCTP